MVKTQKSNVMIEHLRVVLSFLVIFHHSFDPDNMNAFENVAMNSHYMVRVIMFTFSNVTVPIFFMISGLLLIGKSESCAQLVKRVKKLFILLFSFSIFAYIITKWHYDYSIQGNIKQCFLDMMYNTTSKAYWYLYAYIFILVLLPIIRKCVAVISIKEFSFIIIMYVCIVCIPSMLYAIGGISYSNVTLSAMFPHYGIWILFFVGGHFLYANKEKIIEYKRHYWGGVFICTILVIVCAISFNKGTIEELNRIANGFAGGNSVFVIAYSLLSFCIFLCYEDKINSWNKVLSNITSFLGSITLEIYLLGDIMLFLLCPYFRENFSEKGMGVSILLLSITAWVFAGIVGIVIKFIYKILLQNIKHMKIKSHIR